MYPGQLCGNEYFRYLLDTYSDMLIRLCYNYAQNMTDAEDIAQDTFCELVRSPQDFDSTEHEKAWLLRVAANKCKNHLNSARVRLSAPMDNEIIENTAAPPVFGENESDDESRVQTAVLSLPDKYRTIIHLYYYEELTIEQIAKVLKIPPPTVGTRLARGRKLLQKKLGG